MGSSTGSLEQQSQIMAIRAAAGQKVKAKVIVCDFSSPDDAFSQFIIQSWRKRHR